MFLNYNKESIEFSECIIDMVGETIYSFSLEFKDPSSILVQLHPALVMGKSV